MVDPDATQSFVMLAMLVALYFLPGIIAGLRGHPNKVSIMLLNLFLGWTAIGWLAALIWSASAIRSRTQPSSETALAGGVKAGGPYQELERLATLKERGHITAEEFEAEKAKILNS
ncbi:hypothetical protein D3C77_359890 [compost metagenome]